MALLLELLELLLLLLELPFILSLELLVLTEAVAVLPRFCATKSASIRQSTNSSHSRSNGLL
jgi:hypothetical protein